LPSRPVVREQNGVHVSIDPNHVNFVVDFDLNRRGSDFGRANRAPMQKGLVRKIEKVVHQEFERGVDLGHARDG
jgi:hypothetical protein